MKHVGVVILAAGESSRMGTPKLLLPWGTRSVIEHVVWQWNILGVGQVAIVCAPANAALLVELDRIHFPKSCRILNSTGGEMFSSVQCAAGWERWHSFITHWVITLGDQPHLSSDTLRALLESGLSNPDRVCQPNYEGRKRHPVLLPKKLFDELATTTAPNLKQFLQAHAGEIASFDSSDAGLAFDMDTPEDYERLKRQFQKQPPR